MGVGGERVCYMLDGKGFFKEKIVVYDELLWSFLYFLFEGVLVKGMINFM